LPHAGYKLSLSGQVRISLNDRVHDMVAHWCKRSSIDVISYDGKKLKDYINITVVIVMEIT
jgi:hypothetical protein